MEKQITYKASLVILLMSVLSDVNAALVSTIHTDAANQLNITWVWDENVPSNDAPVLTNWSGDISLQFNNTSVANEFIGGLSITEYSENNITPVFMGVVLIPPFDATQYGTILDFNTIATNASYNFVYIKDINPAESVIHLTATTVPLPGAIVMLVSGLLSLIGFSHCGKKCIMNRTS